MNFIDSIKLRAKKDKKRIVLPESMDKRTMEAADKALKEDIADIIIIGTPEEIKNSKDPRVMQFIQGDFDGPYAFKLKGSDNYIEEL